MSRSDQYIGLTKRGDELIAKIKKTSCMQESCYVCDQAFNPYPIHGIQLVTKDVTYKEELQEEMWSGGPMYFTHIGIYSNKTGKLIGHVCSWREDKNLKYDCDYEEGTYWI